MPYRWWGDKPLYLKMFKCSGEARNMAALTRSIRDSETSIDFVQGPPGARRERVNTIL